MDLKEIDPIGLIQEAYKIDGIVPSQCRSIFLDWALKLSPEFDQGQAIRYLLDRYGADKAHPMTVVLQDGLITPTKTGRRGGRAGRMTKH